MKTDSAISQTNIYQSDSWETCILYSLKDTAYVQAISLASKKIHFFNPNVLLSSKTLKNPQKQEKSSSEFKCLMSVINL